MRRVYLPPWTRWVFPPLMIAVWLLVLYGEFYSADRGKLGAVGFGLLTVILLGLAVVLWLLGSGKLPAYLIEEEEKR